MKTKLTPLVLATAMAALLTGCTGMFYEVNPLAGGPPPKVKPTVLVLGDIQSTDARLPETEKTWMAETFKLGVEQWCADHHAFEIRRESAPPAIPADAIVLNGDITEVEKGSAALRFWVGGDVGQVRVKGEFALHAADGSKLTAFVARRSSMDDGILFSSKPHIATPSGMLMQLGQLVGETTDRWARGEKIGQKR